MDRRGLTGNQLKIIAMIAMTCDHVGMQIFPRLLWLRMIGRLAMPIYAFLIAEGCRHTRDRKKYLLRLLGMGALCQAVYNHRRTLLACGYEPKPKGCPRKDGQLPKQDLQKEVEHLRMENKLLRDFLQSTERK